MPPRRRKNTGPASPPVGAQGSSAASATNIVAPAQGPLGSSRGSVAEASQLQWAYEMALRHYETDLELFSNRMTVFLTMSTALLAADQGVFGAKPVGSHALPVLAVLGLSLSAIWLLAGAGAYAWIKEWRGQLSRLGQELEAATSMTLATQAFAKPSSNRRVDRVGWRLRPTSWTLSLPLLFAAVWIYVLLWQPRGR